MKAWKFIGVLALLTSNKCLSQVDTTVQERQYKNIIRYDLSSALVFGIDKYIVFGYERVIKKRQSISVNIGTAALPKALSIITDSFSVGGDQKRTGMNVSIDYRFYLAKENKYLAPRGVYIGPYYSFNNFKNEKYWLHTNSASNHNVTSNSEFTIHTVGFEAGYQFILWKRFAIDFVMAGPGIGFYNYKAKFQGNFNEDERKQIAEALQQLLTQKFPGMNAVFSDHEIDGSGVMKTSTIGYRYLIQIGFVF